MWEKILDLLVKRLREIAIALLLALVAYLQSCSATTPKKSTIEQAADLKTESAKNSVEIELLRKIVE